MEIPRKYGSIFVPKVVMKELDQREKGNVPNVKKDDIKKVCWGYIHLPKIEPIFRQGK